MSIKNIVQLGASGTVGAPIFKAILDTGKFNITVVTRESSNASSSYPSNVKLVKSDYSQESLQPIFKGQDAVIITIGGTDLFNLEETQKTIFLAAIEAGVSLVIPSAFGADLAREPGLSQAIWAPKKRSLQYISKVAAEGKISFTSVDVGAFFDSTLANGFNGIDLVNKKATLIDGGHKKSMSTTLSSIGDAIVGVLVNPSSVRNKPTLVHDFFISQREILSIVEEELGVKFDVKDFDSGELQKTNEALLKEGKITFDVIVDLIRVSVLGPNSSGAWEENDDSEMLGLKHKDLREEIVKVLKQLGLK